VHGVLNTDNCSILAETLDYGPFGVMEVFNPAFTPNTTDLPGRRYCYGNQPGVMHWNVAQLANALLQSKLLSKEEAQASVDAFAPAFEAAHAAAFAAKLGLQRLDEALLEGLLQAMEADEMDFTRTFRWLSRVPSLPAGDASDDTVLAPLADVLPAELPAARRAAWAAWLRRYRECLVAEGIPAARMARQNGANPLYVPRNYLLQQAIEAAEKGDNGPLQTLLEVLKSPFTEQPGRESFAAAAPLWALQKKGVCVLSCSS